MGWCGLLCWRYGMCTTHPRPCRAAPQSLPLGFTYMPPPCRAASQSLPLGFTYMATCSGGPSSRGLPLVIDDGCRCTQGWARWSYFALAGTPTNSHHGMPFHGPEPCTNSPAPLPRCSVDTCGCVSVPHGSNNTASATGDVDTVKVGTLLFKALSSQHVPGHTWDSFQCA